MRHLHEFRPYQQRMVHHMLDHPHSMLWVSVGRGKTVTTLTAFDFYRRLYTGAKMLVVAPLRVAQTVWHEESKEWSHLTHLRFSLVLGSAKDRLEALLNPFADVYVINYHNLPWLYGTMCRYTQLNGKPLHFAWVCWDEVTNLKNSAATWTHTAAQMHNKADRFVGLTGTPQPRGLHDLWGQYRCVDNGERLLPYVTHFRDRWFHRAGFSYEPTENARKEIMSRVADITLELTDTELLQLPERIDTYHRIELPKKLQKQYNKLKQEAALKLEGENGTFKVDAVNAGVLTMKCHQFAQGQFVSDPEDTLQYEIVHDLKLQALDEILAESDQPVLVIYAFRADNKRIQEHYPHARTFTPLEKSMGAKDSQDLVKAWNRREIPLLIGHPKSMGHGLNLQQGGACIVWYGLTWSYDMYEQTVGRLVRSGQKYPVTNIHLIVRNTTDELMLQNLSYEKRNQRLTIETLRKFLE